MGSPIVEVDEFTASYPSLANGEAGSGPIMTAPHQVAANRTRWLRNILVSGVRRIRQTADAATLKALTGLTNGDIAQLNKTGLYTYASDTGGDGELAPRRYTVTGGGILRAAALGVDAIDVPNGIAGLDGFGRLSNTINRGNLIASYNLPLATGTGTGAYAEMTTGSVPSVTITNLQVGDILVVAANAWVTFNGTSGQGLGLRGRFRNPTNNAFVNASVFGASMMSVPADGPVSPFEIPFAGSIQITTFMLDGSDGNPVVTSLKFSLFQCCAVGKNVEVATEQSRFSSGIMHYRSRF